VWRVESEGDGWLRREGLEAVLERRFRCETVFERQSVRQFQREVGRVQPGLDWRGEGKSLFRILVVYFSESLI
jgi:hypothetical protein